MCITINTTSIIPPTSVFNLLYVYENRPAKTLKSVTQEIKFLRLHYLLRSQAGVLSLSPSAVRPGQVKQMMAIKVQ